MMRWIVGSSLKFRFLVIALAVVMMYFGIAQLQRMPVDVFPEFAPPLVEIQTICLGLSAVEVESLVTVPMEQALAGLPSLDVLRSKSVSQLSSVKLLFKRGTDLLRARQMVEERIAMVTPTMPRWAAPPVVLPPLSSTSRMMKIGISSKTRSVIDLSMITYWTIRQRLLRVPGVANVAIWGERLQMLNVNVVPDLLQKHRVTLDEVMTTTADALDSGMFTFSQGHHIGTGGWIDTPNQRLQVRHVAPIVYKYDEVRPDPLANVPLAVRDGKQLLLKDVARVVVDHQPMVGDAIINDGPGLLLIVEKFPWANTLQVTRGVEAALDTLRPGLPDVEIDSTIFRPATFIEMSLHNLTMAMLIGAVLLIVVLVAFLFEWRVATISIVAMPFILLPNAPRDRRQSPLVPWLQRGYEAMLARIIRTPRPAYITVGVIAVAGFAIWPLLGQSLLPSFKERDFLMHWLTKPGTSWPEMNRITIQASKELRSIPGVRNFGAHIGQALIMDEVVGVNFGENWISVDPKVDYDETVAKIQETVDGYPGLYCDVQTYLKERIREVLTGHSEAIVVRIYGDDVDTLHQLGAKVKEALTGIAGIIDLHVEFHENIPQIEVQVDLDKAFTYGLKPGDVRRAATTLVAHEEAGDIHIANRTYDVTVWSVPEARSSLTGIRELPIDLPRGGHVQLQQVADVSIRPTPNVIEHENLHRRIGVKANVRGRDLGSIVDEVEDALHKVKFPLGYYPELVGEYAERQAAQKDLLSVSIVAAIGAFLLLPTSFGSARLAMLSFLTLPSALVGGVLAAYLGDGVLSLGSLIGFLTVLGIAARNGILLIDHCQHLERYEGEAFGPGLVLRGARERISPILMTTLATALAIVPLVVAGNLPGHEIEHPMAVVILGGLVTSTLLNLFVVPSLYLRFGKAQNSAVLST